MDTKITTPLVLKSQSTTSSSPPKSKSLLLRLKSASGFTKTSNLFLFLATAGIFSIFCLSRAEILNAKVWKIELPPGEWYYFKDGFRRFAIRLHHWTVIPAGALLPTQFLPSFRRKYTRVHRIAGSLLVGLLLLGNICMPS